MEFDEYEKFVLEWDNKFPLDRWYREKYRIPFMSEEHRRVSFLSIRLDWTEEQLIKRIKEREEYTSNQNDYLKERVTKDRTEMAMDYLAEIMKKENGTTGSNSSD